MTFDVDMLATMKEDEFLGNIINKSKKQQSINMLSGNLKNKTCRTFYAQDDADLLWSLRPQQAVLIGDNTDQLILLIYHTILDTYDLFFQPEQRISTKNPRVRNIKVLKQQLSQKVAMMLL
ncbi:hypothetical protein MAR_019422, partial [Mya arenaria]